MKHTFLVPIMIMLGAVLSLSGCGGGESTSSLYRTPSIKNDELQPVKLSETSDSYEQEHGLEIFSFWAGNGEEEGIQALIRYFKEKSPLTAVTHAAAGGGGAGDAAAILEQRMSRGDMPGTYLLNVNATHMKERLLPLNDLYESEGWLDHFPEEIVDVLSKDGQIYGVPLDIHRVNVLWYNKNIFRDNGLEPPATLEQLLQTAQLLQSRGISPLILDQTSGLASKVLLAKLGAEDYRRYKSNLIPEDDARLAQVEEAVKELEAYVNQDFITGPWQQAASTFRSGKAAMYVAGDWVREHLGTSQGSGDTSYGWVPFPGTTNDFLAIVDAFGMDKDASNPQTVREWLKVIGSVEGQNVFNLEKGSIPARTDADMSPYDDYSQQTMSDLLRSISDSNLVIDIAEPKL